MESKKGRETTYQNTPNLIQRPIQNLLPNSIMPPRIIIRRVLLAANKQLRMEQRAIITGTDLINRTGVQINKDGAGDVFAVAGLGEDGVELA